MNYPNEFEKLYTKLQKIIKLQSNLGSKNKMTLYRVFKEQFPRNLYEFKVLMFFLIKENIWSIIGLVVFIWCIKKIYKFKKTLIKILILGFIACLFAMKCKE